MHLIVNYSVTRILLGNRRGQLDFFVVDRIEESRNDLCAVYPGFLNFASNGMRVNCKPANIDHSNVRIESQKNEGLHIIEIEIYSIGIIFLPIAPIGVY